MNFTINSIPDRTAKPRNAGLTMVMDKGLSVREAEDLISVAGPYIDIIKLGFGTAYVTPNLKNKLSVYRSASIPFYFGGTLMESFIIRNQFDDYMRVLDEYDVQFAEVSDGSIEMTHEQKCEIIRTVAKSRTVLSEVGSKDAEKIIPPYKWIQLMKEIGRASCRERV